jgi:hypothetical protein
MTYFRGEIKNMYHFKFGNGVVLIEIEDINSPDKDENAGNRYKCLNIEGFFNYSVSQITLLSFMFCKFLIVTTTLAFYIYVHLNERTN